MTAETIRGNTVVTAIFQFLINQLIRCCGNYLREETTYSRAETILENTVVQILHTVNVVEVFSAISVRIVAF